MGFLNRSEEYDYFDAFEKYAKLICDAAAYLGEALSAFDPGTIDERVESMHLIENSADSLKHEMMRRLAHEFITPIEREDIADLAQELDNIIDAIDDVMLRMAMFSVKELRCETEGFTALIARCAVTFEKAVKEFRNFKKNRDVIALTIEVNTIESEGDLLYTSAMRRLYSDGSDTDTKLAWTFVFEDLEACLDAFEHAADIIDNAVMKNT